ncbi:hypothetical protein Gocc_0420 [Gaiella occulta]|uniref:Uncharacterized protein n=1 Tax=Gaiella occulta TaxID=1002870 RepID=A0A7M2Z141_9ACTN|nr:hypothetical protein [Gaiella occulta]RDI76001.1 hypothetical protein Gocc_0420 [Gaiella occulta]
MNDHDGAGTRTAPRAAPSGLPRRWPDPEAVALLVRRARSAGALAAFFVASYGSLRLGYGLPEAVLRGLAAGAASALAVWAVALGFAAWLRSELLRSLQRGELTRASARDGEM